MAWTSTDNILLAAEAIALACYLTLEPSKRTTAKLATKGAASACLVALGALHGAPATLLVALVLALVGDLLLVPPDARVFRAGIVAFLLAHVALLVVFAQRAPSWSAAGIALVPLSLVAILVARRILPRAAAALRPAIVAYVIVITLMVAAAAGASLGAVGPRWLVLAALAFWANDLLVARERFVSPARWHRVVGLPLYYAAMTAFALA